MWTRRLFCTSAILASGLPSLSAAHHTKKTYEVPPEHMPRVVRINAAYRPGDIHVDPNQFALFLILPDRKALRYSVGVANANLWEPGEYHLARKAKWPRWRPTNAMIRRNPTAYAKYRDGMAGGPSNPLGARALYLYQNNRDTYLRIHGTPKPWTIGTAVSNGCARLVNAHVVDLYDRVDVGATVVLHERRVDA